MKATDTDICPDCKEEFKQDWGKYVGIGVMPGKVKCENCGEIFKLLRPVTVLRKDNPQMTMVNKNK